MYFGCRFGVFGFYIGFESWVFSGCFRVACAGGFAYSVILIV